MLCTYMKAGDECGAPVRISSEWIPHPIERVLWDGRLGPLELPSNWHRRRYARGGGSTNHPILFLGTGGLPKVETKRKAILYLQQHCWHFLALGWSVGPEACK